MQIFPFHGFIPDLTKIKFDDAFYQDMREDFNKVFARSVFKSSDDKPCFYILEIRDNHHLSTGLIAMTSMEDYAKQKILKHERTIASKEKIHRNLHATRKAMIKPAALLIHKHNSLDRILTEIKTSTHPILVVKFPDHQTLQRVWKIESDQVINQIRDLFQKSIHHAIIADGHHRFASLAHSHTKQNPQSILSVYFSPQEMQVSTFYRIIQKLKSDPDQTILSRLMINTTDWKEVHEIRRTSQFLYLIYRNTVYRFKLKTKSKKPIHLSFSDLILGPVFAIRNESNSKRIKYLEYPANEDEHWLITHHHQDEFIFILPSLTAQQILNNKKILPPKSTLFSPRIINGLIVAPV